jgi:DNA-binding GntR family transcriptional regulator
MTSRLQRLILVFVVNNKYNAKMSIATYIKDDLAARLLSGQELPTQLTLDSLADHYNVSFTPVRSAVAELIDEGLLERSPNRRLKARTPRKAGGQARRKQKLPEPPRDPFEVVANDLVQLSFQGKPVYLREKATAEKYNIGRSVFRDILHRLAGQGILDHIPRRGWRLRPFRQNDLERYVEVREALEVKALELARRKLDPDVLRRLLDANTPPKSPDVPPCVDESLHEYLITTAENPYIQDFFERHGRYHRLLSHWEDNDRATAIESIRQHREILKAMLAQNWSAARKALSHHILNNHPILRQLGKNANGWMGRTGKRQTSRQFNVGGQQSFSE